MSDSVERDNHEVLRRYLLGGRLILRQDMPDLVRVLLAERDALAGENAKLVEQKKYWQKVAFLAASPSPARLSGDHHGNDS